MRWNFSNLCPFRLYSPPKPLFIYKLDDDVWWRDGTDTAWSIVNRVAWTGGEWVFGSDIGPASVKKIGQWVWDSQQQNYRTELEFSWNVLNGLKKSADAQIQMMVHGQEEVGLYANGALGDGWNVIKDIIRGVDTDGQHFMMPFIYEPIGRESVFTDWGFNLVTKIRANQQNIRVEMPLRSKINLLTAPIVITASCLLISHREIQFSDNVELSDFELIDWCGDSI